MNQANETSISMLRLLRLVRLLTFVKGIPQLRVIVSGLAQGLKSVSYIVVLLILIIYISAIVTALFLGKNDPARFGSVATSMLSLFQVSTLASWTSIAYTSWYGCVNGWRDKKKDGERLQPLPAFDGAKGRATC